MSRSEFFSRAAAHYLATLDAASLTARIDQALDITADEETETAVVRAGRQALRADEEQW